MSTTVSPTVGWAVTGRTGRFVCPIHRPRDVELLPIPLDDARETGIRCTRCDEQLAAATNRMNRRFP